VVRCFFATLDVQGVAAVENVLAPACRLHAQRTDQGEFLELLATSKEIDVVRHATAHTVPLCVG
jgi:hypothetical protein